MAPSSSQYWPWVCIPAGCFSGMFSSGSKISGAEIPHASVLPPPWEINKISVSVLWDPGPLSTQRPLQLARHSSSALWRSHPGAPLLMAGVGAWPHQHLEESLKCRATPTFHSPAGWVHGYQCSAPQCRARNNLWQPGFEGLTGTEAPRDYAAPSLVCIKTSWRLGV